MTLAKNQDRMDAFICAREDRLSKATDGIFWIASDEGGQPITAETGVTTAIGELIADGDLVQLDDDNADGRKPIAMTPAGVSLWDAWTAA
jgi:hypothetical protein